MHGFTPLFAGLEWITLSHNMGTRTTQEGPPESVLARSFLLSPHPRQKRPGVLSTAGTKKKRMFRYKRSRHIGRVGVHWRGLVRSAIGNAFGVVAGLLRGTAPRQGSTQAQNPMKPVRTGDS